MPAPQPRPNQDNDPHDHSTSEAQNGTRELLVAFKRQARNHVESAYPPEIRDCFLFVSERQILAENLVELKSRFSAAGLDTPQRVAMQEQVQDALLEMLAKGWFSNVDQILKSGVVSAEVRRDPAVRRVAAFACFDQISSGRSDFIVDVLEKLVPNYRRHPGYTDALRQGLGVHIENQAWNELPHFLAVFPGAAHALDKVLLSQQGQARVAERLPLPLPLEVQAERAVQFALISDSYQKLFVDWISALKGSAAISQIVVFLERYPLTRASIEALSPHVAALSRAAAAELRYYQSAQGDEYLDNLLRNFELKRNLQTLGKTFHKGDVY